MIRFVFNEQKSELGDSLLRLAIGAAVASSAD